jgi:hypothetical protein
MDSHELCSHSEIECAGKKRKHGTLARIPACLNWRLDKKNNRHIKAADFWRIRRFTE